MYDERYGVVLGTVVLRIIDDFYGEASVRLLFPQHIDFTVYRHLTPLYTMSLRLQFIHITLHLIQISHDRD